MRLATYAAFAALPALVVADHGHWGWHHRNRSPSHGYNRRQGIVDVIESILDPGGGASATPTPAPSSAKPSSSVVPPSSAPPPSSSANPPSSSARPSSSAAPSSSAKPSSSAEPSTSAAPTTTSEQPTPTTEAPLTTSTPETSSSLTTSSSSSEPLIQVITKTVDGQPQVVTETPSKSDKADGGIGTGAIVGIAVGAAVVAIAIVAVIIMFARRGRRTSDDEAIRWPELNRHGDSDAVHALPAHRTDSADRRMSLGSDLDGPTYMRESEMDMVPNATGLNGSNFGAASMLNEYPTNDYPEKAYGYDEHHAAFDPSTGAPVDPIGHRNPSPYTYDEDYTSFPPPVQPQPSPVHGVRYDWETDGSYSDHHQQPQYATMQRGGSPPMVGVGAGAGGVTYPQQHPHY